MIGRNRYKNRIELLQGTLDMLILQTLQWGPHHGYGIVQALRGNSGDVLQIETGSLYPALHRLERQSALSGSRPKATSARNTTESLPPARNSWPLISAAGSRWSISSAQSCTAPRKEKKHELFCPVFLQA
jgi:PadR family transcriptional regulator, regulatory protein PadR